MTKALFQEDAYRFSEHQPLGEWHRTVDFRLVVDRRFKYVWNHDDLDEFYDLQNDPYECINLISELDHHQDRVRFMHPP